MNGQFYKMRKNRIFAGVLAGLCDKFGWDLVLVRILYAVFTYFSIGFGIFFYILLAFLLPYKEDIYHEDRTADGRKRKDADVVDDDEWFW
ncbi:PspC domain-containing protein [Streptococcus dentiloxodontae]